MVLKMDTKFYKYSIKFLLFFGFYILTYPCMKEKGLENLFDVLYGDSDEKIMCHHSTIKFYFNKLFGEYNIRFGSRVLVPTQLKSSLSSGKGLL